MGAAVIVVLISTLAIAAARNVGSDPAVPRPRTSVGSSSRSSFLLVSTGRSEAEVEDILGPPRAKRVVQAASGESECWLYAARSGGPWTYQFCFSGGFLKTRSILPYAIDRLPAGRPAASP